MALGNETINKLDERMSEAQSSLSSYRDILHENMDVLQNNANYQLFVENTEIGSVLNEKLKKVKTVGDKTAMDVEKLLKTTIEFTERQRALNSGSDFSPADAGVNMGATVDGTVAGAAGIDPLPGTTGSAVSAAVEAFPDNVGSAMDAAFTTPVSEAIPNITDIGIPGIPGIPDLPGIPGVPDLPGIPGVPDIPGIPGI